MKTYRKVFYLKCGSMTKDYGSKRPTYLQVMKFTEDNSPSNNEVTLETKHIQVPNMEVSRPKRKEQ